jgi:hypothetical protein
VPTSKANKTELNILQRILMGSQLSKNPSYLTCKEPELPDMQRTMKMSDFWEGLEV